MSLTPPEKVRKLQETLLAKAKGSPGYCFYALYDKVYRRDVLEFAYVRCRSNGGVAGNVGNRVIIPQHLCADLARSSVPRSGCGELGASAACAACDAATLAWPSGWSASGPRPGNRRDAAGNS